MDKGNKRMSEKVLSTLKERDEELEKLWEQFKKISFDNEFSTQEFMHFPKGTHRFDIWGWFDERHTKGVSYLLYNSLPNLPEEAMELYLLNQMTFGCHKNDCAFNNGEKCRFALVNKCVPCCGVGECEHYTGNQFEKIMKEEAEYRLREIHGVPEEKMTPELIKEVATALDLEQDRIIDTEVIDNCIFGYLLEKLLDNQESTTVELMNEIHKKVWNELNDCFIEKTKKWADVCIELPITGCFAENTFVILCGEEDSEDFYLSISIKRIVNDIPEKPIATARTYSYCKEEIEKQVRRVIVSALGTAQNWEAL